MEEAGYLCAILNSEKITLAVRDYQARGEHNPRDFDKYVWQLPIPLFNAEDSLHQELASLAAQAKTFVAALDLPRTRFEKKRRFVREQLAENAIGQSIEAAVSALLEA